MPLYEYHCANCDATVEILVRNQSDPIMCPECQSQQLEKLMSVTAAPSMDGARKSLPVAPSNCGMPRCCGGGCQM